MKKWEDIRKEIEADEEEPKLLEVELEEVEEEEEEEVEMVEEKETVEMVPQEEEAVQMVEEPVPSRNNQLASSPQTLVKYKLIRDEKDPLVHKYMGRTKKY